MTIPNVAFGETLAESWGDAVADKLNDLPDTIQHGTDTATFAATANETVTITYGVTFASAPRILATIDDGDGIANGVVPKVVSKNTTTADILLQSTGTPTGDISFNWIAIGTLA